MIDFWMFERSPVFFTKFCKKKYSFSSLIGLNLMQKMNWYIYFSGFDYFSYWSINITTLRDSSQIHFCTRLFWVFSLLLSDVPPQRCEECCWKWETLTESIFTRDLWKSSGESAVLQLCHWKHPPGWGEGGRLGSVQEVAHDASSMLWLHRLSRVHLSVREEFSGDAEKRILKDQFL